jgi:hypothetical protein
VKKYKFTGKRETAYQWCIEAIKNLARLLISLEGHITDKDILSYAVSMNNEIQVLFEMLNSTEDIDYKISQVLIACEKDISENITAVAKPLIEFLKNRKKPCSVQDFKNSEEFRQIDGDLNLLLDRLSSMKVIEAGNRVYTSYANEYFIDETVYFVE